MPLRTTASVLREKDSRKNSEKSTQEKSHLMSSASRALSAGRSQEEQSSVNREETKHHGVTGYERHDVEDKDQVGYGCVGCQSQAYQEEIESQETASRHHVNVRGDNDKGDRGSDHSVSRQEAGRRELIARWSHEIQNFERSI